MAIYAVLMVFAAIVGAASAVIDAYLGLAATCAFVGIWAAMGVIIAAPVIVEAGRPGKLDDLLKYLLASALVGPFMLTGMLKGLYGAD